MRENFGVKTLITDNFEVAAEYIRRGRVVAFPTETVYGLGANIFDEAAIAKIFEAKRRPADNPLIVHIADLAQISTLTRTVPGTAQKLIDRFFPGPLTVVLEKSSSVTTLATAGLNTVGIRMPRNPVARQFLAACATPVAAPSANISGRPSPTNWQAVLEDLDGRIACVLRGEMTEIGLESTVVDCTAEPPSILRTGAVSLAELRAVVSGMGTIANDDGGTVKSPGLKHRHYSPAAQVNLVAFDQSLTATSNAGYIGIHEREANFALKKICRSVDDYARELFEFFREGDRLQIPIIYCEIVPEEGIGAALMDRVRRAAE